MEQKAIIPVNQNPDYNFGEVLSQSINSDHAHHESAHTTIDVFMLNEDKTRTEAKIKLSGSEVWNIRKHYTMHYYRCEVWIDKIRRHGILLHKSKNKVDSYELALFD